MKMNSSAGQAERLLAGCEPFSCAARTAWKFAPPKPKALRPAF